MFRLLSLIAAVACSLLIAYAALAGFKPIEKVKKGRENLGQMRKTKASAIKPRYAKYAAMKPPQRSPKKPSARFSPGYYGGSRRSSSRSVRNSSVRSSRSYRSRSYGGWGK